MLLYATEIVCDAEILFPLIQLHVAIGTENVTNGWRAHAKLRLCSYMHETVNHCGYFVRPGTGSSTQLIESVWNRLRFEVVRHARNVGSNLPKWLAVRWWRSLYTHPQLGAANDLFETFETRCQCLFL